MAPKVFAVYTNATSWTMVSLRCAASETASGNAAPNATVIGIINPAITADWRRTTDAKLASGNATAAASTSGTRGA
jgi:hypothetical protein